MTQWLNFLISSSACFGPGHLHVEFRMDLNNFYSKCDLFLSVLSCSSLRS